MMTVVAWPSLATSEALVFYDLPGCPYCIAWKRDIGPIYPNTIEGKRLPLIRINIAEDIPVRFQHLALPEFTPTFVVVDKDDQEIGRVNGYDPEFFWWELSALVEKLDAARSQPATRKE